MTGPEGEKPRGWWQITAIEEPTRFEFDDGFADDDGNPVEALGIVHGVVALDASGGKTRMTSLSRFESAEQLEQMMEMGMEEGMREAIGQIDAILAELGV